MNAEIAKYLWIGSQTSLMPKFFTSLKRAAVKMSLNCFMLLVSIQQLKRGSNRGKELHQFDFNDQQRFTSSLYHHFYFFFLISDNLPPKLGIDRSLFWVKEDLKAYPGQKNYSLLFLLRGVVGYLISKVWLNLKNPPRLLEHLCNLYFFQAILVA